MYSATLCKGILHKGVQPCERVGLPHPDLSRLVCDALLRPHPDNVVYIYIVAKQNLASAVDVYNSGKVRQIQSEIIQESAVLPEDICIVGIVRRGFVVPQENKYAALNAACELFAACGVCFFAEHGVLENIPKYIKFVAETRL